MHPTPEPARLGCGHSSSPCVWQRAVLVAGLAGSSSGSLSCAVGRAQPSRETQQGQAELALGPTTASGC